jgi:hypothetical protein
MLRMLLIQPKCVSYSAARLFIHMALHSHVNVSFSQNCPVRGHKTAATIATSMPFSKHYSDVMLKVYFGT